MDKTDIKTFFVPNDLCKRGGIAGTWLPDNQLSVYPFHYKKITQKDAPSIYADGSTASVFHIRQNVILFHPILRKLVNESNAVFLAVPSLTSHRDDGNSRPEFLKSSRQYRSIIRACLENLQDEIEKLERSGNVANGDFSEKLSELRDFVTIFYSVECIWHLCEILFVDFVPGAAVLPQLLDWVRFHFPKHERNAARLLADNMVGLEAHDEYWDMVIGSLLQGRIKVARALLKQHSSAESNAFKVTEQILRTMPVFNITSGLSVNEFNMQLKHWRVDVRIKLDAQLFATCPELDLIMRLIIGEENAWAEVQQNCETWYALLAGWLFYTEPTVKSFELGQFAKKCIAKMGMTNKLRHLDRVLLAAMEFDILQVIKEIQLMNENGWFVTHLTDMFYHSGKLNELESEIEDFSADKLHNSFILDYGILLMSHKSLWQVGLNYLDNCGRDGLNAIELLLPRLPLDNEARALKIIREAKNRDLLSVVQTVCKVEGMLSLRRGRLGNALTWALKSQDGPFTSYLADKFLQDYTKNGRLPSTDLLDNLGSCILASDRLIFLGKYYEFQKLYKAGEFKEAANLLISLLASKIIPNYFWYILLVEAIPLLECEELVMSSNDTYTILHSLEEKSHLPQLQDKIDILRLAASRNLARALIFEAQCV